MKISLSEFEEIPGNLFAIERLISFLSSKKAIAFVGAGASIGLYSGWSELLRYVGEEAIRRGMATEDDVEFWNGQASTRPQQVARMIREKFGENVEFYQLLGECFKSKTSTKTGNNYTDLHKAIVKLPFRGIVTTNYDPGLWNALLTHRNNACNIPPATWADKDTVRKWRSEGIFSECSCPLLHIHGSWLHPNTIILDIERYRSLYSEEYFIRMFRDLWDLRSLVIIGCGFSDTWLDRNLDQMLSENENLVSSQHIALIGIRERDYKHVTRYRMMMHQLYRAIILFYKIEMESGTENHDSLTRLIESIRYRVGLPEAGNAIDLGQSPIRTIGPQDTKDANVKGQAINISSTFTY